MSDEAQEIRCSGCKKLLAKLGGGLLMVHRGDFRASFDGEFRASFICSRPGCGRLNVVQIHTQATVLVTFKK
jgi:phage FluMu protein Com